MAGCKPFFIDAGDPLEMQGELEFTTYNLEVPYQGKQVGLIQGRLYIPVQEAPAPLVVFMPGFSIGYVFYSAYFQHLASHGYAVLAMNPLGSGLAVDAEHDDKALQVIAD